MADEVNDEQEPLEEGYTNFGGTASRAGGFFTPTGPVGKFFAKFFATKTQKIAAKSIDNGEISHVTGDTVINTEIIKDTSEESPAIGGVSRNPVLPQLEMNRRRRYKEYEEMDEYPEIGAAFDIYADDSSQRGPRNEKWTVVTENAMAMKEIENLFNTVNLDKFLWDIIRNTVKYGDCFTELIININRPEEGIKKVKILNPNYILRVENEFGYLKNFLQEIPNNETFDYGGGTDYLAAKPVKYIRLDKNQIVHFRLHTSDPIFYPYGKSIAALCHRVFRSLKMMEDAMLIYRLTRAPERRIFYVDTGNLPTSKAEMYIERLKEKFKKEKYYNTSKGTVDARFNPLSMDEDYFVPTRGGRGTKIDTLPGAQNLGAIEDVQYYRDKLLASLKIPKDYIVEKQQSPERKANLSQLDVKFARTIHRVQICIETGLENLAKRHLQLRGYPALIIKNLKIRLPEPSDMSAKRKLDLDEQKTRVIQAVQGLGLFSKKEIYREYYEMTDVEITQMEKELKDQMEEEQQQMQEQGGMEGAGGAPGAAGAGPGPMEAGGQEGAENTPPTAKVESTISNLENLKGASILKEEKIAVVDRIIDKQLEKIKKVSN